MMELRFWYPLAVCTIVWLTSFSSSSACSCVLSHPQDHYCWSDYVILATVKKTYLNTTNRIYSVKVNKIFKATDTAMAALQKREILSPRLGSSCGVTLNHGVRYLITGRILGGSASINLCNFYQDWDTLTVKQKKGFKLLYERGCECKVLPLYHEHIGPPSVTACQWETLRGGHDCQGQQSVCMRQSKGRCDWNQSRKYRECMKLRDADLEWRRNMEP